jgi:hypothetical protein
MARQRILASALLLGAAFCGRPAFASAACDPLKFFTFHSAEKSAFATGDYSSLYRLNLEEAKYADACGHREAGADRENDLEQSLRHYTAAGNVELDKHQYALARKHLMRSNAIVRELQAAGHPEQADILKAAMRLNDSGLARIRTDAK